MTAPPSSQFGQHARPSFAIAHISDTHLRAEGSLQFGVIDTMANLRAAMERLMRVDPTPQALVFTGDLADRAEPAAYRELRDIVDPIAEQLGAQVIWAMGNHDERAPYAEALFGVTPSDDEPPTQDRVYDVEGLRIVSLDTTVPGFHHGEITGSQLAWLRDVLATPAQQGTILALHHPPIPIPMLRAAELIELADQDRLAEVLDGSDVISILGGHFHFSSFSTFAGIPISVAAATCYLEDPAPLDRFTSGVDGHQSVNMVHVYPDRVVHSIVPISDAPEVISHPSSVVELIEALTRAERRELISSKASPLSADFAD